MSADILIVDDEKDIRSLISDILKDEGYICRQAANSDDAFKQIRERYPQLVILDIWMKDSRLDGLELLRELHKDNPNLPVIMISGHGTIETAVEAIKIGAFDFIEKPFKTERLLILIANALAQARLKEENRLLKNKAKVQTEIIGKSKSIENLKLQIQKVGPTNSRVLIQGPPGSGKEVVARSIHLSSQRKNEPFVVVHCPTLHPDLFEEELFGLESHQRGGGIKIGLLERAHGGTLYLDEVSNMPLETQSKIIRVLQDESFRRVHGAKDIQVNIRILASTSLDLQELIKQKKFREELFYRLNVVPLKVPSLKERNEDISQFIFKLVDDLEEARGIKKLRFAPETITYLQTLEWPGNVRQLKNLIEWLLIMLPDDHDGVILPQMIPADLITLGQQESKPSGNIELLGLPLKEAREQFEKDYLLMQLERFGGNVSKTSEYVGMERSALHRKLKGLGV